MAALVANVHSVCAACTSFCRRCDMAVLAALTSIHNLTITAGNYLTLQAAVDDLPADGGTVFIPAGTYNRNTSPSFIPPLKLPKDKPVRLLGEGKYATK